MPGLKDRLMGATLDGLNAIQDRVVDFETDGGFSGLADRVSARFEKFDERIASGRTPLNPEYREQVRVWYARLELPVGADADEVRRSFRRLMRQYHPDRFTDSPEDEQTATELSQMLSVAYEGLLEYLGA